MRTALLATLLVLLCVPAVAQYTAVTATVKDINNTLYVNCTYTVSFIGQNTVPGHPDYTLAGVPSGQFQRQRQGECSSTATLNFTLPDNNQISPLPSQWQFSICSQPYTNPANTYCFSTLITITTASQNITTPLQTAAAILPIPGGGTNVFLGYLDAQKDCGLTGYPADDTIPLNNCIANANNYGKAIGFRKNVSAPNLNGIVCDYTFTGTIVVPKTTSGITLFGFSSSWNDGVGLCWTTNVPGIRVNTYNVNIKGFTIANTAGLQWVRGTLATYGVPNTNYGVQSCGPRIRMENDTVYYWPSDGIHLSSADCTGGSTDYLTADKWELENVYVIQNIGYGVFAGGSDGNVGKWSNGQCTQNQLGCFADVATYGNIYSNVNGDSNGSDPNVRTGVVNITSCTITEGNATCTIPTHGFIQNDWVTITGNTLSSLNTSFPYINRVDANTISFPCGCGTSATGTGGTAGYLPGARVWASNNLYAGGLFVNNPVGPVLMNHVYMEGTNGPSAASLADIIDGQGFLSTIGGYYLQNSGTVFARVGSINTVGNQSLILNNPNNLSYLQVNAFNPTGNIRAYSFFVGGASATATGTPGVANDDCSWGSIDTSPYVVTQAGRISLCRWPHISTTTLPFGGYWWLRSAANNGSTAFNAIGVTDHQSVEGDGFAVIQNGIININSAAPASVPAGENITYTDSNSNVNCKKSSGVCYFTSTVATGTATLGTTAITGGTCAAVVTVVATGIVTTDTIDWAFNADPSGVAGYGSGTAGTLVIWPFPTAGNVNFRVCNNNTGSITPGAATLNWRVTR